MSLPNMKYSDGQTKSKQVKFAGLKHVYGAGDGEIWDMENMTGDHYPVLATRTPRRRLRVLEKPGGLFSWDKLCWVDGTGFYYDGVLKGQVAEGQKRFCALGRNIIIWPDKCCYNVETDTFASLESRWQGEILTFSNGLLYDEEAEANAICCQGVDWSQWFREGDAVTISGCTTRKENNKTPIIRQIDGDKLYFYEHTFTLENGEGYEETGNLVIERRVPDLKFLCENENRLWGWDDSTIYASKLGDPFNWNVYDKLASDSFAVTPGAAGVFLGGISYKGFAVVMKEFRIYKIYGSVPSSFQAVESASIGLAEDSPDSLAIAGETLFYLSSNGIMAYSGGIPQPVSGALGRQRYSHAVGGSDGLKYYVSMQDESGEWWLYVYDTLTGLWHKEDRQRITHFARMGGNLYFLNEEGEIWIIGDEDTAGEIIPEGAFEWMVEFADFTEKNPDRKWAGRLQLRAELEEGAYAEIFMQYDSDGIWQRVKALDGGDPKRSYLIPIIPRRCDHYRLKITGSGGFRLYSLAREFAAGSEMKSTKGRNE